MGPCAVCGSLTINAAGHCAHCGTYRGLPGPAAGQPGYPPPSGQGYPTSGPGGYPPPPGGQAQPISGAPGYPGSGGPGYPGSAPPAGYPTSGGGYPTGGGYQSGYPAPVPPGRNRPFMIPLIALASTLVVLVIAIVVVLAVNGDDNGTPTAGSTTSTPGGKPPSSTPKVTNPDIDECMVGTWEATSHREDVNNSELGKLSFVGSGTVLRLRADGSGESDYGNGTSFSATANDKTIRLEILGLITFRYTAVDGRLSVTGAKSDASFRFFVDEEQYGSSAPFTASNAPSNYNCSGDSMTQKTLVYTIEYKRVS